MNISSQSGEMSYDWIWDKGGTGVGWFGTWPFVSILAHQGMMLIMLRNEKSIAVHMMFALVSA